MGDWLAFDSQQPGPNRDAIGSWIEVRTGDRTTQREVTIGGGHAGGELGWIHFGLGGATEPRSACSGRTARSGPWLDVDGGSVRHDRARCAGTADLDPQG